MSKAGEPSWKWRRLVVFATIAFCFFGIASLIDGMDTELNRVTASGFFWLAGSVIVGYIFGATAQDAVAIVTARTGRPYAPDIEPAPPPTTINVSTADPNAPPPGFAG